MMPLDPPLVAIGVMAPVSTPDTIGAMPPCAHLAVRFDGRGGAFDGLSRSGVLVILRNVGSSDCRMPG